jgi:RimJ/RimL family protein N-acetyltransferase
MTMALLVDPVVDLARLAGPQPQISRRGLTLRRWTVRDCPTLVAAFQDEAIRKWTLRSLDTAAEAAAQVARWKQGWKRHVSASWAVVAESEPTKVLGQVGFRSLYPEDGMAEVSYWVLPHHRRQGIATRAADALALWSLELGLGRLELVHSVHNPESCGVARAAGFEIEGIKRRLQLDTDGYWHDMCLHSRIADRTAPPPRAMGLRLRVAARLDGSYRAGDAAGRARELAVARR